MKSKMKTTMNVNNNLVGVLNVEGVDYISFTMSPSRWIKETNAKDCVINVIIRQLYELEHKND